MTNTTTTNQTQPSPSSREAVLKGCLTSVLTALYDAGVTATNPATFKRRFVSSNPLTVGDETFTLQVSLDVVGVEFVKPSKAISIDEAVKDCLFAYSGRVDLLKPTPSVDVSKFTFGLLHRHSGLSTIEYAAMRAIDATMTISLIEI